jgi:dTDP-4-dehydrorhamnose 3,5-epimerase
MKVQHCPFKDAFVLELEPFEDHRGMFCRLFCQNDLQQMGIHSTIRQINHSRTRKKGAVRGMHFQYPPMAETKFVTCLRGSVFDVMIDLRSGSPDFIKWHGEVISIDNRKMLVIPEGFAHGFQALEDDAELLYFHTEFYSPEHEGGIRCDDPLVAVSWPEEITDLSDRDRRHPFLTSNFRGIALE